MNYMPPLKVACCCIFFLAVAYIYHPIMHMSFSIIDDPWMLLVNKYTHPADFGAQYFKAVFTRINDIQYSPVNTLYYALIYRVNKFDPYFFHLFNVVLHLCNALMILLVSERILQLFDIDHRKIISIITAMIWCIHPINVEPVIWVSGSKILLCTLFSLLSFYGFLLAFSRGKSIHWLICIVCFIISMFIKEQGMMTPYMFILFILAYKLRFPDQQWSVLFKSYPVYFILIVMSVTFCLFTVFKVNEVETSNFKPIATYPLLQRILLCFFCLRFYLVNLIFPVNLHYHYPFPIRPYDPVPLSFYAFPLMFVLFFICLILYIWKSKNFPFIFLCVGILLIQLSLELQIIPMTRPAIMADRYMYLPSFSLILLAVSWSVNSLYKKIHHFLPKRLLLMFVLILFFFFVTYSEQLVFNWSQFNIVK